MAVLLENAATGQVDAWIDFNDDGDWDDAGEKILDDVTINNPMQTLNYDLPGNLPIGDRNARVRLSSVGGLAATGGAPDGEVEDYLVSVLAAPKVAGITINDGDTQRSGIETIQIAFDQIVDIDTDSGDVFEIRNQDTSEIAVDVPVLDHTSGVTVVSLTFTPGGTVNAGGGLEDGDYRLTIDSERVLHLGIALDGDDSGSAGGNHVFGAAAADAFYRKYGDFVSNGAVDLLDFARFRQAFGKSDTDPDFEAGLDSDSNGMIDLVDFAKFRQNFGT